jgi:chromosome segregation ATPase
LVKEKGQLTKLLNKLKEEKSNHTQTSSKLDVLHKTSEARIAKFDDEIKYANEVIEGLRDDNLKTKSQAVEIKRELDKIQSGFERKGRRFDEEKEKVNKQKEEIN